MDKPSNIERDRMQAMITRATRVSSSILASLPEQVAQYCLDDKALWGPMYRTGWQVGRRPR